MPPADDGKPDPADGSTTPPADEKTGNGDGGDGGQGETQGFDQTKLVADITVAFTSEMDRRIGGLVKTLVKDYGLKKAEAPALKPGETPAVPDHLARRLLKSAVRETMADQEFGSLEERKAAWQMASKMADAVPIDGDDDYEVAAEIVGNVMSALTDLRATYTDQVRADLKRRGLLVDEGSDDKGQPPKKPGQGRRTAQQQYDAGKTRAIQMFPGRIRKPDEEKSE